MSTAAAHRDRTLRLSLFGLLTIFAGIASLALGGFYLAAPSMEQLLEDFEVSTVQAAIGAMTFGVIGMALIACGAGSMRYRRWARPAMLTVGWTWLLVGLASLAFVLGNLDDLVLLAGGADASQPPEVEKLVRWILVGVTFAFGVIAPLAILGAYASRDVLLTCHTRHPAPDWSDRCPSTVLVLALALGFAGLLLFPMILRPALPWFGKLLTGTPGAILTALMGALFIWTGWALFRLQRSGLWATGIVAVLLGISAVWTLLRTERAAWYRALDYPEKQIRVLLEDGEPPVWPEVTVTIVLTIVTVIYLVSIRRHFGKRT